MFAVRKGVAAELDKVAVDHRDFLNQVGVSNLPKTYPLLHHLHPEKQLLSYRPRTRLLSRQEVHTPELQCKHSAQIILNVIIFFYFQILTH